MAVIATVTETTVDRMEVDLSLISNRQHPCCTVRVMEIAFQTKPLRDICESGDKLKRHFGDQVAERIKTRLADLRAASTIREVLTVNPRQVIRDGRPAMTLDLGDGHTMVFCPNHLKMPTHPDSSIDWSAVSRIKIVVIENNSD